MGEGRGEIQGGIYQHTPLSREKTSEDREGDLLVRKQTLKGIKYASTGVTSHLEVIHVLVLQRASR